MEKSLYKKQTGRYIGLWVLLVLLVVCTACGADQEHRLSGKTMGTTWGVAVVAGRFADMADLQARIERRLAEVNAAMSTYLPDSEISRFNAMRIPGTQLAIGQDFADVLTVARRLHRVTGGALDPTIKPLVDLWGFGKKGVVSSTPSEAAITLARRRVGFKRLTLNGTQLSKQVDGLVIDLAAIAKGYGVDVVAREIRAAGFDRFLVEIGGEVVASGRRKDGNPWRVGISDPRAAAVINQVYQAVWVADQAMATSGDYRQYFEVDGRRYSHVIDPRTGRPVANGVVSVTILAPSCTVADGLATAVMVMGAEAGLSLVERLDKVEVFIVVADGNGELINVLSSGFPRDRG